jgi:hypothetical protein
MSMKWSLNEKFDCDLPWGYLTLKPLKRALTFPCYVNGLLYPFLQHLLLVLLPSCQI